MGLSVTGEQMIFRNEKQGKDGPWASYSTGISKKDEQDNWKTDYYEVVFVKDAKGADIPDKTKIRITDAFLSFRLYQDKPIKQIVVKAYTMAEGQPVHAEPTGYTALTESDLPF